MDELSNLISNLGILFFFYYLYLDTSDANLLLNVLEEAVKQYQTTWTTPLAADAIDIELEKKMDATLLAKGFYAFFLLLHF